jgi:hypothetical protein
LLKREPGIDPPPGENPMTATPKEEHYTTILEQLKTRFPCPISNPMMDGYFIHTLSHFLDRVDDLK